MLWVFIRCGCTGIGALDKTTSAVFESVSGLTGGAHMVVKDQADGHAKMATFKTEFVSPPSGPERQVVMIKRKLQHQQHVKIGLATNIGVKAPTVEDLEGQLTAVLELLDKQKAESAKQLAEKDAELDKQKAESAKQLADKDA